MATGERRSGGWSGWRIAGWGGAAALLLTPLVNRWPWDETDFILLGAMLAAAGGSIELAARMSGSAAYRAGFVIAVAASFILIWMNLAVGIIGSEDNPANLMFAGVLAVGIGGAIVTRFGPRGMARAATAAAVAQAVVAVVALVLGSGVDGEKWPTDVLVLSGFFVTLWLVSAALFARAARE